MGTTLAERVRERLGELRAQRRFLQVALAERLDTSQGNISKILHPDSQRPITLDFLQAAAELAQVPIAELVAPPGSTVTQLSPDEAAVVRALRAWPLSVTRSLCAFLAFFADEPPAAGQTRRLHELWRHLPQRKRDQLFGFAAQLSEGLPPDVVATLFEQLSAGSKAAVGKKANRHG